MATIVVPSKQVIKAAEATITRILKMREERDRKSIERAMQPRKVWFKVKTRTEAEAIAWLEEADDFGRGWRSSYAWGTLAEARALLKLAQHGDPVTLNEKDIEILF